MSTVTCIYVFLSKETRKEIFDPKTVENRVESVFRQWTHQ